MTELDIKKSSLTQAINQLTEVNAIIPQTIVDQSTGEIKTLKGEYIINPEMFWKGDLKKRKDLIVTFQSSYEDPNLSPEPPEYLKPRL